MTCKTAPNARFFFLPVFGFFIFTAAVAVAVEAVSVVGAWVERVVLDRVLVVVEDVASGHGDALNFTSGLEMGLIEWR